MFTNQARLLVVCVFAVLLAVFIYMHTYEVAAADALLMLVVIWGYFNEGPIILAAKYYHNKDYDKAEELLLQIRKPEWLRKNRRGFYEFMLGGIALKRGDFTKAEAHYELAAQYPLRSANDHVAALVHVANISVRNANYDKAEAYLKLATRQEKKVSAKMKEVIAQIEKELKTRKAK
ncbi:tetratricopeptide repeat protein [uncultured Mucilaginibacter sp.]|uniref:tetratricopeptide repeat protein n=1 Tax=uncultured Mucilaginibacter sp. TaxID=797541 RepID=UPI0025FD6996|nr:tetratricopeptide repeat protein [uncultured Mucilaginibacter sp.]